MTALLDKPKLLPNASPAPTAISDIIDESNDRFEIINGEKVIMPTATPKHGLICISLSSQLYRFVNSCSPTLGYVFDSSTMFRMNRGNMRVPDISFLTKGRMQTDYTIVGAPDLVVEVISPNNTFGEMHDKLVEYFESGTRLAWLIHSEEEYALVYHNSASPSALIKIGESLSGESVIPNFSLALQDLFPKLDLG
jgi:Uma2 family endonuclease